MLTNAEFNIFVRKRVSEGDLIGHKLRVSATQCFT